MSNTTLIIVIVIAIVVVAAIAVVGYRLAQQKRTERLREQYGPEYDRALDQADSQRAAESELRDRSKRHERLELRSLDSSEREDFELRQAVTSYRSLVLALLAEDGDPSRHDDAESGPDNNKQMTERETKA